MSRLSKISSDFLMPKVRDSFVRGFAEEGLEEYEGVGQGDLLLGPILEEEDVPTQKQIEESDEKAMPSSPVRMMYSAFKTKFGSGTDRRSGVQNIVLDSNEQRLLLGDSGQIPVPGMGKTAHSHQSVYRKPSKKYSAHHHRPSMRGSTKLKSGYDHLKENGYLASGLGPGEQSDIVLSLFVAVILDNLELDEEIKKIKQTKAREQSVNLNEKLPLRLRIFQKFRDSPQMSRLSKISSDFLMPKVRDSFVRGFAEEGLEEYEGVGQGDLLLGPILEEEDVPTQKLIEESDEKAITSSPVRMMYSAFKTKFGSGTDRRSGVQNIVLDSNEQRLLLGDSGQIPVPGMGKTAHSHQSVYRKPSKKYSAHHHRPSMRGSTKLKSGYDHLKENGYLASGLGPGPTAGGGRSRGADGTRRDGTDIDYKMLQAKKQQAEMRRNQLEEDLRENHPLFDTPLFLVGRESRFRKWCQWVVYAQYTINTKDPITGKERKVKYKRLQNLLGLVPYLDWVIVTVTILSCVSMFLETPTRRMVETPSLQIMEYVYVVFTSVEIILKILADGLLFTPKALIRDVG
ncbi:unnamed protein product, partial [Cyprideis torosa]